MKKTLSFVLESIVTLMVIVVLGFALDGILVGQQIPLTGSIGVPGSASVLGYQAISMTDANLTLTPTQWAHNFLNVTSSVSLTATRNLVGPLNPGQQFTVENSTTGGKSIQVIGATGTGVTIPNGSTMVVASDGTNYHQTASSGASSAGAYGTLQGGDGAGGFIQNQVANGPIWTFGTSVTQGTGSFVNGNSYVDVLETDSGNNLQNWGVGGSQMVDIVEQTFRKFPQSSFFRAPLVIFDPFINDANHCGNTTGCLANAAEALNAAIAWTAIPASYRTYATSATNSGFAAGQGSFQDPSLPQIAMSTTTQNATLTFNLTNAGSQVGLTFTACDAYTASTFTVTLGGTLVDTINPKGNSGQAIVTQNGQSCAIFRKEYANSSGATVSLVVQKTDANTTTAGTVTVWAVDTNPSGAAIGAPLVLTEGTIMQNANANAATTSAFDAQANTTATAFQTDGWNSYYMPLRAGQTGANPGVNSTTDMANNPPVNPNDSVGLHPNSGPGGGHDHLAQTIENFVTGTLHLPYFNKGISGGHAFFYQPWQGFMNFAPTNIMGYNNLNANGTTLSQTNLIPGGILVNGYTNPVSGVVTAGGIDFGYDTNVSSYITRIFGTGYVEICPTTGALITTQAGFACGHDIFWSNGDYQKLFGFFRPKGGISYENQGSASLKGNAFNADRSTNQNWINTSAGNTAWMLPLCKANTYDYQLWYYKSTGDTNSVSFNAYNTLDSINGNTSTVTGAITAYSINLNVITVTAANSLVAGQAATLSGFGTSTFLNGASLYVSSASSTQFVASFTHANASVTESGTFGVNASWTGMTAPYSSAMAQCSVGPTGLSTITITQSGSNVSGTGAPATSLTTTGTSGAATLTSGVLNIPNPTNASALNSGTVADARLSGNVPLLNTNNIFTGNATYGAASDGITIVPGFAGSIGGVQSSVSMWQVSDGGAATFVSVGGTTISPVHLSVVSGITNNAGLQIATGAGCTISAGAIGNKCNATLSLPIVEPDTSYVVTGCSVTSPPVTGGVVAGAVASLTTSNFVVTEVALDTTSTGGGTINCLVTH